jgi:acetoin utilization protein AcuC
LNGIFSIHPTSGLSTFGRKGVQKIQTVSLVDTRPAVPQPIFVGSEAFRRAAFGDNHPLKIIRHSAVMDLTRILGWLSDDNFRACDPASTERLLEFHDRAYVKALQHADARGRVEREVRDQYQVGTLENPLFEGLFDRAARTVGGSILAAELALEGHTVFHPSGGTHHGRADRACGFCYFNDPVFAIKTFLDAGIEQVYYVDLDAHHGDGVEIAFFDEPRVSTLSIHEDYRWPYSGSTSYPEERAFNVPVAKGFNDSELEHVMENAVLPLAETVQAEALVVCCGADCLAGDPLSTMMLSNVALWQAVDQLLGLDLPAVIVGGGGYNPWTVTRYWTGLWGRIRGQEIPDSLPQQAIDLLHGMECDLVDEEDVEVSWYNTLADTPNPGPVRESVKSLVKGISL